MDPRVREDDEELFLVGFASSNDCSGQQCAFAGTTRVKGVARVSGDGGNYRNTTTSATLPFMSAAAEIHSPPPIPAFRLSSFYFAYYAALGAFTPYWALFLKHRGMDVAAISILMSLWYATRIIAPTTWTTIAARSPRPIRWLRIGCALTLASFAAFVLPMQFTGLFAGMVLFCFAYNAVMPQFEAITLSHLPGRSERYGRIRVWGSIGFILVVAGFGPLLDGIGIGALPWLMLPLFLMLLGSAAINDYARAVDERVEAGDAFWQRLKRPEVLAFFAIAFLTQISFGPYYTFFSIYMDGHGYTTTQIGGYWTIGVVAEIVVFFLAARIFARWKASTVLVAALLSAALRWWVIALFPDNVWLMSLAQVTHALNFAGFFAAAMHLLAQYFPGRMNGHGQGVFYGFSSGIGGVVGALLAGQLWTIGGGRLAFLVGGGFCLVAAAMAATLLKPRA